MAIDTLADAERLAAEVLAEAEQRARRLLGGTRTATAATQQEIGGAIEDVFRTRHEEILAILTECRDLLRNSIERSGSSIDHHTDGGHGIGSLAAIDYFALPEPSKATGGRSLRSAEGDDRVGRIRMSAQWAAKRAAAERLAMQAEAVKRSRPARRARADGPLAMVLAASRPPADGDDVAATPANRRSARTQSGPLQAPAMSER